MQRRGDRVTQKDVQKKKKQRKKARETAKQKKQKQTRMIMFVAIAVVIILVGGGAIYYASTVSKEDKQATSGDHHTQTEKADFSYKNHPVMGDKDAPVKIVEFGDYKCPSCRQFDETVFPKVKKNLLDKGKASFYFMNYPIIDGSIPAALAAESIYSQGNKKYWQFHQAVYDNQGDEQEDWATTDVLVKLAKKHVPGVDVDKLQSDIKNQKYMNRIKADADKGTDAGVTGTPTIFVNGKKLDNTDFSSIQKAVEKAEDND